MEERLARLEGRVEELSKRVEEGLTSMNKRIDDLRNDVNHRFAAIQWEVRIWFLVLIVLITTLTFLKP